METAYAFGGFAVLLVWALVPLWKSSSSIDRPRQNGISGEVDVNLGHHYGSADAHGGHADGGGHGGGDGGDGGGGGK